MWTCVKCHQSVDDQYTACPHCGAARSAGRFSRGVQPRQTPMAQYTPDRSPIRAGRGYMVFGSLLTVLIPAALLLLAMIFRKSLLPDIYRYLYPEEVGIELSNFKSNLLYWILAGAAALTGTLPGLWTVGIGKALRRLARLEERL